MLSRPAAVGLGLVVFASTLGVDGCLSYKLTGMYVEPSAGACVSPGATAQYSAYGTYTEGGHETKTEDLSDQVTWSSDIPWLVASISSSGLVTAPDNGDTGTTNIKASAPGEFGTVWASATFTVPCASTTSPTVITRMRILPGDQNLASVGDTSKVVAVGEYSRAPWSSDFSQKATWTSSNPKVATVAAGGLVTAAAPGEATITATHTTDTGTMTTATIKVTVGGGSDNQ